MRKRLATRCGQPVDREHRVGDSALPGAAPAVTCMLRAALGDLLVQVVCVQCVLRRVVCRSWVAPVEVVEMVLDDLGERDDGTSSVPPMCFSMPTSHSTEGRRSRRGMSWEPAPESATSSTTATMHLRLCFM